MEVKSATYNNINMFQVKEARSLIEKISKDYPSREFEVIVDVGCGSGNVTKILEDVLPHKRIVAFDIDDKMVNFADNNNQLQKGRSKTEYVVEDVSKSWETLSTRLTSLEGTVDLIFSNYVLHWVDADNVGTSAANICRLLKPGGLIVFNVGIVKPICDFLSLPEKEEIERHIKIETPQNQMNLWRGALEKSGVANIESKLLNCEWEFDHTVEFVEMLKLFRNRYFKFVANAGFEDDNERAEFLGKVEEIVYKTLSVQSGTAPGNLFGPRNCRLFYDRFTIHGVKSQSCEQNSVGIFRSWCSIL